MANDNKQPIIKAFGPSEDCPSLDDLVAGLAGTEAHLTGCSHCRTELTMFRDFQSPAVRPEEQAPVQHIVQRLKRNSPVERTPWWKAIWSVKVFAPASIAMAAAALVLTVWVPRQHTAGPDLSGTTDTFRSARLDVIAPTGTIHESPRNFQWQPVKGAVSYNLHLFEVDNTEVWSAVVSDAKTDLPASIGRKLRAPKALNWRVTAINAAGNVIGDSGTLRFSIAP